MFREALDSRAKIITVEMLIATAKGIASLVPDDALSTTNIYFRCLPKRVLDIVAKSVSSAVTEA